MQTAPQIVWLAHGSPVVDGCGEAEGRCYVCCGHVTRGKQVVDWLGTNFTDQNRARAPSSKFVCEACCYVMSRTSPVLNREAKEGNKFGGNFRNYAHLAEQRADGSWWYGNASKGEKIAIRSFLRSAHEGLWFAAIPDSGQKHMLPFTPLNGPGRAGRVLFEEQLVDVPEDQALIDEFTELLTAGVTKEELTRGDYRVNTMREMMAEVQAFERTRGHERDSGWFTLALWLAQRNEEEHAQRSEEKTARDVDRRTRARPKKRVPRGAGRKAAAELLGDVPGADASGGTDDDHGERVGDAGAEKASAAGSAQLGIPGID